METSELNPTQIEQTVKDYCDNRVPENIKDKIWIEYIIIDKSIELLECRPLFTDTSQTTKTTIATIIYSTDDDEWLIFWKRPNGSLERYLTDQKLLSLSDALIVVDSHPNSRFYG